MYESEWLPSGFASHVECRMVDVNEYPASNVMSNTALKVFRSFRGCDANVIIHLGLSTPQRARLADSSRIVLE